LASDPSLPSPAKVCTFLQEENRGFGLLPFSGNLPLLGFVSMKAACAAAHLFVGNVVEFSPLF